MVVLKREGNPKTQLLDSPRRFANSFTLSWEVLCSKSANLLKLQLLPAAFMGILGCLWLRLYSNDIFWNDGWYGIITDTIFGMIFLFFLSAIRIEQQKVSNYSGNYKVLSSLRSFAASLKNARQSCVPLLCAGVIVSATRCILKVFEPTCEVTLACVGLVSVVAFSAFGTTQSYIEVTSGQFPKRFKKGLMLNGRYFGSFCILFLLSILILSCVAIVLFYGSFILQFLDDSYSSALLAEEESEVSRYVVSLKYPLLFIATALLTSMQPVWSLPQQIHIKSVISKETNRSCSRHKKTTDGITTDLKTTQPHD